MEATGYGRTWIQKLSRRYNEGGPQALGDKRHHNPGAEVQLWAQDEHRLGLKPLMRKVWALKGERPLATVHHRYKWTYLYSFVRPCSGEVHWLILPTVNSEVFSIALSHFAEQVGA